MQRWGYGLNSYWRTASVWLEEGPWWAFWLAEWSNGILFYFAYRHIKQKYVPIKWDKCKELFYADNPAFWDEEERDGEERRREKPLDEMAQVLESMGMPRPDKENA